MVRSATRFSIEQKLPISNKSSIDAENIFQKRIFKNYELKVIMPGEFALNFRLQELPVVQNV